MADAAGLTPPDSGGIRRAAVAVGAALATAAVLGLVNLNVRAGNLEIKADVNDAAHAGLDRRLERMENKLDRLIERDRR